MLRVDRALRARRLQVRTQTPIIDVYALIPQSRDRKGRKGSSALIIRRPFAYVADFA